MDATSVVVQRDASSPVQAQDSVSWAIDRFVEELAGKGIAATVSDRPQAGAAVVILLRTVTTDDSGAPPEAESYAIHHESKRQLVVSAADPLGFAYGLSDVARCAAASDEPAVFVASVPDAQRRSAVPIRGLQRVFSNVAQDSEWFHDRTFWTEYLEWLASCRFNRFHLAFGMQYNYSHDTVTDNYLCFVYPFLFDVDGYHVRAAGVEAAEQRRNLESLRFVSDETRRRGMRFQLGLWNHAFDYGAESHQRYAITGLDDSTHPGYCAKAVARLLSECPSIDGLTFRVHYEGGIREEGHEIFWDQVFSAAAGSGRELEIDLHAKGVDQLLVESASSKPGLHPVISAKYWAEHFGLPYHQASIRAAEAARPAATGEALRGVTQFSRRFTRYGYGDFLSEDRQTDLMFRVWPGTQRLLMWGDPEIAAGYARCATFAGARGLDLCEPLTFRGRDDTGVPGGHDPYLDSALRQDVQDWKKYRYAYLLWGRLLHDPDTDPRVWHDQLKLSYGAAADDVAAALGPLSKILPLVTVAHGASGANNLYWPEMYVNLPISPRRTDPPLSQRTPDPRAEALGISYAYAAYLDDRARGESAIQYTPAEEAELVAEIVIHDTDHARNFGGISPFDPTLFYSVDDYVRDRQQRRVDARYTPLEVARWIDDLVTRASGPLAALHELPDQEDAELRRTLVDLDVLSCLGRFFEAKFRAAVDYATFEGTGHTPALESCIATYETARGAYADIGRLVEGIYQPALSFGKEPFEGGTWSDRLPSIDRDLAALVDELTTATSDPRARDAANYPPQPERGRLEEPDLRHQAPPSFDRGQPLDLTVQLGSPHEISEVTLHYRHVDQSEQFQQATMLGLGRARTATVPGSFTAATYPLIYFFSVRHVDGRQGLVPGLDATLANQPYLLLHSSSRTS